MLLLVVVPAVGPAYPFIVGIMACGGIQEFVAVAVIAHIGGHVCLIVAEENGRRMPVA